MKNSLYKYVIATIALLIAKFIFNSFVNFGTFVHYLIQLLLLIAIIVGFLLFNKAGLKKESLVSYFKNIFDSGSTSFFLYSLFLFLGCFFSLLELSFVSMSTGNLYEMQQLFANDGWVLVFFSLLAVLFEELFFRKLICDDLTQKYNYKWVVIISAALFYLAHFDFTGRVPSINILAIGISCAYFYIKTKSLITPILIHLGYNLVGVLGIIYLPFFMGKNGTVINDQIVYTNYNFFVIGLSILTLFIMGTILRRKLKNN